MNNVGPGEMPWIINAPMNKQIFNLYVETQLAPTLSKGDVVIMDNLASSPDLNPIEMAFAKIKALLRKAAARTYDQVWQSLAEICQLFPPNECLNYFKAAGYEGH